MSWGRVKNSNLSSMPEVAGDASFLVNPLDPGEISEAMHCLATDATFSKYLSVRGRSRAEEFHWDTCATAMAAIYKEVEGQPAARKPMIDPHGTEST